MHFRTRAIHVGNEPDPQTGAVVPPVHISSTFVQPGAGEWGAFDYSRSGNPTRKAFETTLANLEGGYGGLAFASGMAATHCVTMLLSSGDHIIAGSDIYGGTFRQLHKIVNRAGITVSLVNTAAAGSHISGASGSASETARPHSSASPYLKSNSHSNSPGATGSASASATQGSRPHGSSPPHHGPLPGGEGEKRSGLAAIESAITPNTKLVWIESPGNPQLSITDIAACAELTKKHNILLGVDCTFASPALTRPLELGADIVMHSATKYIGGHSDLLGGALVARDKDLFDRLYFIQNAAGAVMAPWEAYLCSRGLKTLELRMREHCHTAQQLAEWLNQHPKVKRVLYPGLPTHPGHEIAKRQMQGAFGAMLSFDLGDNFAAAKKVAESTKLFHLAVSLGAVESLIEQPASMSHASYDAAVRKEHGISDGLVRLSIGLEAFEDLRDDLDQALAMAFK